MIRRALATFTVSLAVVTAFSQSVNNACQPSTAKKPSAAVTSSKLKPAVQHAKPSATSAAPRKPSAVLLLPTPAIHVYYPRWGSCEFARCGSAYPFRSRAQR
jgi:hypothetical protein